MTIFVKHRINTLLELDGVNERYGVEIDVRYHENDLILHHDPFKHHLSNPCTLDEFLSVFEKKGLLIINIKTEGIEEQCINLLRKYNIQNWFFLDLSMPYFIKYSNRAKNNPTPYFSKKNLAVRFSDFEPIEYALSFEGKADWVWVDTFKEFPLSNEVYKKIKAAKMKICIVSPELQNHNEQMQQKINSEISHFEIDAICTKFPELWQ